MNTLNIIITLTTTAAVVCWLIKRKHNLKNLIISAIILAVLYTIIISLSHKLTVTELQKIDKIAESVRSFGTIVNLTLLSYSIIMVIINILLSPLISISTTVAGSIYLIYSSIFSKVIPILELNLSVLSNISQLALLVLTSIIDIVTISEILLKVSKIIIPTILIERTRIVTVIIVIVSIILSITSVMLLKSINIGTIRYNNLSNILKKSVEEYDKVVNKKYTIIVIDPNYPSLTLVKVRCNEDNISLTIIGIGKFRNVIPCANFSLKISSMFFDLNVSSYSCSSKTIKNITVMYCKIYFNNDINIIDLGRYYVGYFVSNCSSIVVDLEGNEVYVSNPSPLNCTVNLYLPEYVIIDQSLADEYINYIGKVLRFLKIYNDSEILNNLKYFYMSIRNIAYYSHTALLLRNFSSYVFQINNYRYVNWPSNISHVSYNEWLYDRYLEVTNTSRNILSLNIAHFLKDEFSKVIISFIYSILLDTLGLVALFCVIINLSSIENIFYKIFIRISKSVLYDFILILYFRIVSSIIARRVLKRILLKIKGKGAIIFVESKGKVGLYEKIEQKLKVMRMLYLRRYREPNVVIRKCRDIVYKSVDSRIIREIEGSRAPIFHSYRGQREPNIIVKDIIRNLYGKDLKYLNINLKDDRRLLFLLSALYKNYDNIINMSLDVRLTPLQIVLLALRREILEEICRESDEFSRRLRYLLEKFSDRKSIEHEFKEYIRDLYNISTLLSSRLHRKISTRILMDVYKIYDDVNRLHIFKVVKRVLDYYIDRRFVSNIIDRYLEILYRKYSSDVALLRNELRKVRYIRRLFRLR